MSIEDMLAAFLNKDTPATPDWCQVDGYEEDGTQVHVSYSFPCLTGRKSSEMTVSLLELMAFVWGCSTS